MKIDTLVCSGGGPSGIAYSGIFKALIEKGVINQDLDGIKEIIPSYLITITDSYVLLFMLQNGVCEIGIITGKSSLNFVLI